MTLLLRDQCPLSSSEKVPPAADGKKCRDSQTDNKQRETLEHSNPICLHKSLCLGLRQQCGRGGGIRAVNDIWGRHRQLTETEAVCTGRAESAPGGGLELG